MLTCKTTIVHWVEAQVPVSAWHDYYILEKSCWSLTPISLIVSQRGDLRGDHSVAQRRSCRLVADRPVSIWAWPGVRDGGQARVQGHHQFSELLQVVGRVTVREVEFPGSNPSLGDLHDNSDQSGHTTPLCLLLAVANGNIQVARTDRRRDQQHAEMFADTRDIFCWHLLSY